MTLMLWPPRTARPPAAVAATILTRLCTLWFAVPRAGRAAGPAPHPPSLGGHAVDFSHGYRRPLPRARAGDPRRLPPRDGRRRDRGRAHAAVFSHVQRQLGDRGLVTRVAHRFAESSRAAPLARPLATDEAELAGRASTSSARCTRDRAPRRARPATAARPPWLPYVAPVCRARRGRHVPGVAQPAVGRLAGDLRRRQAPARRHGREARQPCARSSMPATTIRDRLRRASARRAHRSPPRQRVEVPIVVEEKPRGCGRPSAVAARPGAAPDRHRAGCGVNSARDALQHHARLRGGAGGVLEALFTTLQRGALRPLGSRAQGPFARRGRREDSLLAARHAQTRSPRGDQEDRRRRPRYTEISTYWKQRA